MTEIVQFNTTDQAMMAKGMLAANGINAEVQTNTLNNIFPGAGSSGATLYVDSNRVDDAYKLLREHGDM